MFDSGSYTVNNSGDVRQVIPTWRDAAMLAGLAMITGVFLGLALGVVLAMLNHPHPVKAGAAAWAVVQAGAWLALIARWGRLIDVVELALGVDVNRDGRIGQEPEQHLVRVEVDERGEAGQRVTSIAELPFSPAQLARLGSGLLSGASFSEASWSGSGQPFTRSEFRQLRDTFLARGWAQWKREGATSQGVTLTSPGLAVARYFCQLTNSPTLPSDTGRRG